MSITNHYDLDSLLDEIDNLEKTIFILEFIFQDERDEIGYRDLVFKIMRIKDKHLVTHSGDWHIKYDSVLWKELFPNRSKFR